MKSIVPNMGVPLLLWKRTLRLVNNYELWERVPTDSFATKTDKLQLAAVSNELISQLDGIDLHIRMQRGICIGWFGMQRKWFFDFSMTADNRKFDEIRSHVENYWSKIVESFVTHDPSIVIK